MSIFTYDQASGETDRPLRRETSVRKTSGELARSRDCSWIAQSIEQTVTVAATVRKPSKARKKSPIDKTLEPTSK